MTDRELDALVSEKVMGVEVTNEHVYEDACWLPLPRYSTDIAAAWKVVEGMREVHRAQPVICRDRAQWDVSIGEGADCGQAYAATAPRAICLAALRALGVKVPS